MQDPTQDFGFHGSSSAVSHLRASLAACQADKSIFMLVGEAGCGKTYAARQISGQYSGHGPLLSVVDRDSLELMVADPSMGGFLVEEIGAQSPAVQKGLQAYLQTRGATPGYRNCIITSSWPPARLVQEGKISEVLGDLLTPHCLFIPTVKERHEDLAVLCEWWQDEDRGDSEILPECVAWLQRQTWPGNFRQMRQLMHLVSSRAPDGVVTSARLDEAHRHDTMTESLSFQGLMARYLPSLFDLETDTQGSLYARVLAEVERPLFRLVLKATEGNQIRAAALLGLNRNTLRKRLQILGIEVGRFRS